MSVPNAWAERRPICQASAEFMVMTENNEAEYVRTPIQFTELSTRFSTQEFTYAPTFGISREFFLCLREIGLGCVGALCQQPALRFHQQLYRAQVHEIN